MCYINIYIKTSVETTNFSSEYFHQIAKKHCYIRSIRKFAPFFIDLCVCTMCIFVFGIVFTFGVNFSSTALGEIAGIPL